MKDENYFVYAGNPDKKIDWILIHDTQAEREEAIKNGYTAFSTMSFSHEYEKGQKEPNRKGDLWLDFDSKESEEKAIHAAREFVLSLRNNFEGFEVTMVRYFLSGNKGCHICIPSEMFGDLNGSPFLPKIHKAILDGLLMMYSPMQREEIGKYIDPSLYCMGKGKLLRESNVERSNGRYKVEVEAFEFFELDYDNLKALTMQPRYIKINTTPPRKTALEKVFNKCVWINDYHTSSSDKIKSMMKCKFMQYCILNSESLSEKLWFLMLSILAKLGEAGLAYAHKFSKDYPEYSEEETNRKFHHAMEYFITCKEIRSNFKCPESCKNYTPCSMYEHMTTTVDRYIEKDDGLYYIGSIDDSDGVLITSYIKMKGRFRNFEGTEWGFVVEIKDPLGNMHTLNFYNKEIVGDCDKILADLVDAGLELKDVNSIKRLKEYLRTGRADKFSILANNTGWKSNNVFVMPDKIYGYSENNDIIVTDKFPLLNCSGTLKDWNDNIGEKCIGNPLLIFLVNFAMTGPFLNPCGIDGGGIHLFGSSSSGKTTSAYVAGSVYGGNEHGEGYKYTWNGTTNGFERIAFQLNDLFLFLDELGQATSKAVSALSYMLANGFGKLRMKSDASIRTTYKWTITFLSTGEMTLADKIEEDDKGKAMAGQTVRVIDIPIDGGASEPTFPNIHGMQSSREFSNYLKNMSCKYYGTVIRELLSKLFGDSEETLKENIKQIQEWRKDFIDKYYDKNSQSQVGRIAERFSVVYAVGLFAVKNSIVHWPENESIDSVVKYYNVAVKTRGGLLNKEIITARKALFDEIDKNGTSKYLEYNKKKDNEKDNDYNNNIKISDFHGYVWNEGNKTVYFIIATVFNKLIGNANRDQFCQYLVDENMLPPKKGEFWSRTESFYGRTRRGYSISIPIVNNDSSKAHTYDDLVDNENDTIVIDNVF